MPRVALTPAQREAAKRADQAQAMADRLAVYKNRHSLSNKAIAADLICHLLQNFGFNRNCIDFRK